jgi:hypothetical protein
MVETCYGSRGSGIELPAGLTIVPVMKKSIILVSALSVVVMVLVSCASSSDVDPYRVDPDKAPVYHEAAPAHQSHISPM